MRKKLLIGALMLLLITPTTVFADATVDYSQYGFTDKPVADCVLIEDTNITNVGGVLKPCIRTIEGSDFAELQLDDSIGNYKVVEFITNDVNSYLGYFEDYELPDENADGYEYTKVSLTSTKTLEEVLTESDVVAGGTVLNTVMQFKDLETNNYLLFFSENAIGINDLEFIISFKDLFSYKYVDTVSSLYEIPETLVKSTEILKDNDGVIKGCKVAISYNFKNQNEYPIAILPEDATLINLDSKDYKGVFSFNYLVAENGTYKLTILTNKSNEYSIDFTIDSFEKVEDYTEEIVEVDNKIPNITISGNSNEKVTEGTDISLNITSDIEVSMNFNGSDLGKGTSFIAKVDKNDEYHYTAISNLGVFAEGSYKVDCFIKPVDEELVDDELNNKLVEVGEKTGDLDEVENVAQTGVEGSSFITLSIILIIAGVVVIVVTRGGKMYGKDN